MALTEEQIAERQTGIGGSDAPIIMGVSSYKDLWTLYMEKRGEVQSGFIGNQYTEWGDRLEPLIAQKYADETGNKIRVDNKTYRSKEHPFMIGHIDRRVVGTGERRALECKTAAIPYEWGPTGSNEIPQAYLCQVQHYIHVLKLDVVDVAVLIAGNEYRQYEIPRNDELIRILIEAEEEFWDRVEAGVSPDPVFEHGQMVKTLSQLFPGTNGSVVELPSVAQKYHDVLQDAREQRLIYEKMETGCKNRLAMLLGESSAGLLPDGTCYTRKSVTRKAYEVEESTYIDMRHTKKLPKAVEEWLAESQPQQALENADGKPTDEGLSGHND
jgi:putative phage-type endonuclease